jgi:hypothetical protein
MKIKTTYVDQSHLTYYNSPLLSQLTISYSLEQFPTASFTIQLNPDRFENFLIDFNRHKLPLYRGIFRVKTINYEEKANFMKDGDEYEFSYLISISCDYFLEEVLDSSFVLKLPKRDSGVGSRVKEVGVSPNAILPLKKYLFTGIKEYRYFPTNDSEEFNTTPRTELNYILNRFGAVLDQSFFKYSKLQIIPYGSPPKYSTLKPENIFNLKRRSKSYDLYPIDVLPIKIWRSSLNKLEGRSISNFSIGQAGDYFTSSMRKVMNTGDRPQGLSPTPSNVPKCFTSGTGSISNLRPVNTENFNSLNDNGGETATITKRCYINGVIQTEEVTVYGYLFKFNLLFGISSFEVIEKYTVTYNYLFVKDYYREDGVVTKGFKKASLVAPNLNKPSSTVNYSQDSLYAQTLGSSNPDVVRYYRELYVPRDIRIDKTLVQEYDSMTLIYPDLKKVKSPYPLEYLRLSTEIDDSRDSVTLTHYSGNAIIIDSGSYSKTTTEVTITDAALCNIRTTEAYLIEEKSFTINYNKGQSQRTVQNAFQNIEGRPPTVTYTQSDVIF